MSQRHKTVKPQNTRQTAIIKLNTELNKLNAIGKTKAQVLKEAGGDPETAKRYIRSIQTMKNYKTTGKHLIDYCLKNTTTRDFSQMQKHAPEYINYLIKNQYSKQTIKSYMSGINKIYNLNYNDLKEAVCMEAGREIDFSFHREEIVRSRDIWTPEKVNFEEKPYLKDIKAIVEGSGLRRREVQTITPSNIYTKDGFYYFNLTANKRDANASKTAIVSCKGGRTREYKTLIKTDSETGKTLQGYIDQATDDYSKIFNKPISHDMDIHDCRSIFAMRLYEQEAKPIKDINPEERVPDSTNRTPDGKISRIVNLTRELKGYKLDRLACKKVSQALGHSRDCIFQQSYLKTEKIEQPEKFGN